MKITIKKLKRLIKEATAGSRRPANRPPQPRPNVRSLEDLYDMGVDAVAHIIMSPHSPMFSDVLSVAGSFGLADYVIQLSQYASRSQKGLAKAVRDNERREIRTYTTWLKQWKKEAIKIADSMLNHNGDNYFRNNKYYMQNYAAKNDGYDYEEMGKPNFNYGSKYDNDNS